VVWILYHGGQSRASCFPGAAPTDDRDRLVRKLAGARPRFPCREGAAREEHSAFAALDRPPQNGRHALLRQPKGQAVDRQVLGGMTERSTSRRTRGSPSRIKNRRSG